MKDVDLSNWPSNIDRYTGILLFAQLWHEMLFDYSMDSYKATIFNLPALCEELIHAYKLCDSGILSWNSIPSIRDELLYSLNRDKFSQQILGDKIEPLRKDFIDWSPKSTKIISVLHASNLLLKYLTEGNLQKLLQFELSSVVKNPKQKKEIIRYSRRLLTELLRLGYSPQYLYRNISNTFFYKHKVNDIDIVEKFLNRFDNFVYDYEVVLKLPRATATLLARKARKEFLKAETKLEPKISGDNFEKEFLKEESDKRFLVFSSIKAKDPYAARDIAENRLFTAISFVGFFIHELEVPEIKQALVYIGNPVQKSRTILSAIKPTLKRPDVREEHLGDRLSDFFGPFISSEVSENTSSRLISALGMHVAGTRAIHPQNQFSNLWTSLETLIGCDPNCNTIGMILERVIPIMSLEYFLKFLFRLHKDLLRCLPNYKSILEERKKKGNEAAFLLKVLTDKKLEKKQKQLLAACDRNPLLRFRIFNLREIFISPKRSKEMILAHEQRITWHIQRIYRARNQLIHAGEEGAYLPLLIDNLHGYLDYMFKEIVEKLKVEPYSKTIEQVFYHCKVEYEAYKKMLLNLKKEDGKELQVAKAIVFREQ